MSMDTTFAVSIIRSDAHHIRGCYGDECRAEVEPPTQLPLAPAGIVHLGVPGAAAPPRLGAGGIGIIRRRWPGRRRRRLLRRSAAASRRPVGAPAPRRRQPPRTDVRRVSPAAGRRGRCSRRSHCRYWIQAGGLPLRQGEGKGKGKGPGRRQRPGPRGEGGRPGRGAGKEAGRGSVLPARADRLGVRSRSKLHGQSGQLPGGARRSPPRRRGKGPGREGEGGRERGEEGDG